MKDMGYIVENVSNNPEYYHKGDFKVTSPFTGATKMFEVKFDNRINKTGNLYLEIANKNSKGALGWYRFTEADYIVYGDAVAQIFYIVPLAELKKVVDEVKPRVGYCAQDSAGYLLPLDKILDLASIL